MKQPFTNFPKINPTSLGKVGVLYGGLSAERDISLLSGQGVYAALRSIGVDAHLFDTGAQGRRLDLSALLAAQFDRVFIALHGRLGEDGCIQGVLEHMGLPYTGSGVLACAVAMDKVLTKRIWLSQGLPTPRFVLANCVEELEQAVHTLGLPLAIKPPQEGSTIGFSKLEKLQDVQHAFDTAAAVSRHGVLVEEFIQGRELTVAILGSGEQAYALPVIEIIAPAGNYDYQNKYFSDDTQYLSPAPLDQTLSENIQALALRSYQALGCSGWGRVDIMLQVGSTGGYQPFLLEVNTAPGMTSHSLVPMAAKTAGIEYPELCAGLLQQARCGDADSLLLLPEVAHVA